MWNCTHPKRIFRKTIFRLLGGAAPPNFYTRQLANVYLPQVDTARSAYANALEFWLRDFATRRIVPPIGVRAPSGLTLGFALNFQFFKKFQSQDFRDASTDRREILHGGQYQAKVYNAGSKFRGPSPKNFRGQKHAKFGQISDDFEVRRRISPKRMKIFEIELKSFVPRFPPALGDKSSVNIDPLIMEIKR